MKIEFEKILLALAVMMMLTLGMFHSCNNKEQYCHEKYPVYNLEYDSIEIIDEYNDFCIIHYNADSLINIYASFEDMNYIDSFMYSMENAETDELVDYLMKQFGEEVNYKWSDYLKQYVLCIKQ